MVFGFEGMSLKEELQKAVILDSSMVEHSAVNRVVVGSSPTRGVCESPVNTCVAGLFCV